MLQLGVYYEALIRIGKPAVPGLLRKWKISDPRSPTCFDALSRIYNVSKGHKASERCRNSCADLVFGKLRGNFCKEKGDRCMVAKGSFGFTRSPIK